jgi:oxygen-independent coproporphyrinogen-3 oxidase
MKRRELQVVSENQEYEMYHCTMQILAHHGYEHYEISNFARPGWRSTHNQRYWSNDAYWGFGVGAASYVCGERRVNIRDTRLYIQKLLQGKSVIQTRETLPPKDRAYETMALQLRRSDGIHRGSFYQQTGFRLDDLVEPRLHSFVRQGLLSDDGQSVSLTHDGKCVADAIITTLMFP